MVLNLFCPCALGESSLSIGSGNDFRLLITPMGSIAFQLLSMGKLVKTAFSLTRLPFSGDCGLLLASISVLRQR